MTEVLLIVLSTVTVMLISFSIAYLIDIFIPEPKLEDVQVNEETTKKDSIKPKVSDKPKKQKRHDTSRRRKAIQRTRI